MEEPVCSLGIADDGRLVVAMLSGVYLLDLATARRELVGIPEPMVAARTAGPRLNDGKVGPDGAFWVGSMHPDAPTAGLFRVSGDAGVEPKATGLGASNGLAFSADGSLMLHSDSRLQFIDTYAFDAKSGSISNRRRIATPDEANGRPDGGATDMANSYWSAGVSAGCLNRYDFSGNLLEKVRVHPRAPTMPCFGGPELKTLFFTSLQRPGNTSEHCGGLYFLQVEEPGVPVSRFRT